MSKLNIHKFSEAFITEGGDGLPQAEVAYRSWGTLNRGRDNAVLVCHALTGNAAADEWFGGLFGAGRLLDPGRNFILCANVLGSCYGTTGPLSVNPETGRPYRAGFPEITIRDMVRLQQRLLDELNIRGIDFVIGGSMGGMLALEFCIMDNRPGAAILLATSKAHSPWAIGISHSQRQAIYNDPRWNDGFYTEGNFPSAGLALARIIAMNSYRSPSDFKSKFGRELQHGEGRFCVESYLDYQGGKLAGRFDAVSYVRLTQAMDSHDVSRNRGGFSDILRGVHIPVLVAGIDTDMLYPVYEQKELAHLLPRGSYAGIRSPHGHDAFLIEFEQINRLGNRFLSRISDIQTV